MVIQVAAGVMARAGSVLVCQRAAGGHHPGKWEFPGGKLEPGENLEAGLRRELNEELAIDAVIGPALWRTRHQYPGRAPFDLVFFFVPSYTGELTNRIFAAVCWAPIGELTALDFLDGDREFVALLEHGRIVLPEP